MKMKLPLQTKTKRRLAAVAGVLLVLLLLLCVDFFTGDPLSRAIAQRQALRWAEAQYPGQEFTVEYTLHGGRFSYDVQVQSQQSEDTLFYVTTDWWIFCHGDGLDGYENLVESGWNTCLRMGQEAAQQVEDVLLREAPELKLAGTYSANGIDRSVAVDLAWTPEGYQGSDGHPRSWPYREAFPLDAPFDKAMLTTVPARLCLEILWPDVPDGEDLETVLHTLKQVMEQNGLPMAYYDVTLVPETGYETREEMIALLAHAAYIPAEEIP